MNMTQDSTEKVVTSELRAKMDELSVVGCSYLGTHTIEERMAHLQEVERILRARNEVAVAATQK
jgi:hypothetical protein